MSIDVMKQALEAYGATHREPTTGALYKKIDGIWYIWCRIEDEPRRWIKSLGTSESCLDPITPPAAPVQEPVLSGLRPDTQKTIKGWIADGTFVERAIGALQEQERENMRLEKLVAAQRQWVGLTQKQRNEIVFNAADEESATYQTEDKLRELNGGQT